MCKKQHFQIVASLDISLWGSTLFNLLNFLWNKILLATALGWLFRLVKCLLAEWSISSTIVLVSQPLWKLSLQKYQRKPNTPFRNLHWDSYSKLMLEGLVEPCSWITYVYPYIIWLSFDLKILQSEESWVVSFSPLGAVSR